MFPNPDTYYAVLKAEREVLVRQAERRAPLLEAARRPRPARRLPERVAAMPSGWLALATGIVRWVLRPAQV